MQETKLLMGMPVSVRIDDAKASAHLIDKVFRYFSAVDEKFSTYKTSSEISLLNRGKLPLSQTSIEMQEIFRLAEETKQQTHGYFNIQTPQKIYDPSGLVKGWAIWRAAQLLKQEGVKNFFIDVGGDVQAGRSNTTPTPWQVGIRSPFNRQAIVKILNIYNEGVATSGTYIRGQHIYNPFRPGQPITNPLSITVVGPNVYEADRFATAAFAMGLAGIDFIEQIPNLEAYQIDQEGVALQTSGFAKYTS